MVLGKYGVGYEHCGACGSLQTEPPYWLDEAYDQHHLAAADTGAVARCINAQAVVYAILWTLGLRDQTALDYGGGNGLLCRLLRDIGIDARLYDRYAVNDFAVGFEDDTRPCGIVCAFEVAEHFASPGEEFSTLLSRAERLCVVGTETYTGQAQDWWYLAPDDGQHVFFTRRLACSTSRHGMRGTMCVSERCTFSCAVRSGEGEILPFISPFTQRSSRGESKDRRAARIRCRKCRRCGPAVGQLTSENKYRGSSVRKAQCS